jgi:hypothetical protein
MTETPSPRAWVTSAQERLELEIQRLALTEWQVAQMPHGDLRKALGALEAVLAFHTPITRRPGRGLTCRFDNHRWPCDEYDDIMSSLFSEDTEEDIPPREIRRVIARKLLGEEETDGD